MKIGDKVIWHTGEYAGEQGQREKSWHAEDKRGTIVATKTDDFYNAKVLIETTDGTRTWEFLHIKYRNSLHLESKMAECEQCQWWKQHVGEVK